MKANAVRDLVATHPVQAADAFWEALYRAYQEPERSYHTFDHVVAVLVHYAAVADDIGWQQPRETFLAVLFHDAVYVCGRSDNEEKSAELAAASIARWLPDAGIDSARVVRLIQLTAQHGHNRPEDVDDDAALFLDCDLAILGAPPDIYQQFCDNVASEYQAVIPPQLYRAGRRKFLGDVLGGERIFLSDYFETKLGAAARRNVAAELAALGD